MDGNKSMNAEASYDSLGKPCEMLQTDWWIEYDIWRGLGELCMVVLTFFPLPTVFALICSA